jgi:putative membrane protein
MMLAHAGYAGAGWWWFAPWLWIPFWILLFVVVRGLFWRRMRRHHGHHWGYWHGDSDPRSILAQRYARGEIGEQEYRDRLKVLTSPPES